MRIFYFMTRWKPEVWDRVKAPGVVDSNDWQFVDQMNLEPDKYGNLDITPLIFEYEDLKRFKSGCDIKVIMIGEEKSAIGQLFSASSCLGSDYGLE